MHLIRFINLLLLILVLRGAVLSQTVVDLPSQSRRIDFSTFPFTRPVKTGTATPSSCTIGDLFFKSDAVPGANLMACVGANTWQVLGSSLPAQANAIERVLSSDGVNANWTLLGGDVTGTPAVLTVSKLLNRPLATTAPTTGFALVWDGTAWTPAAAPNGAVGLALEGTTLATRGLLNFVGGVGIITALTDTGTRVDIQQSLDTAVILTRDEYRSSSALACNSASTSDTTYTCTLSFPLLSYPTGSVFFWKPDVDAAGGAITLQIGSLAAIDVKLSDGTTNPTANHIKAGRMYPVWYDGTSFRLITLDAPKQGLLAGRPTCSSQNRGAVWLVEGPNGTKDEMAVCAKNDTDVFDWRVLY
jgi:hypothetical protein